MNLRNQKLDLSGALFFVYGFATFLMLLFSIILFAGNAEAANGSTVGSIRVQPGAATSSGTPEMDVTVTYVGDDNANNQIRVEWGLDGVDFSLGDVSSVSHPAIPYSYAISSLSNSQVYQVRVSIVDGDGVTGSSKTFTGLRAFNRILHNSVATGSGSSKWANGWGISDAGAGYGEFTCNTCHDPSSSNIKRIRSNWSAASVAVPAQVDGDSVSFSSAQDGSAQYALDDSTDHTSSNRICEACHTLTSHHRHDESSNGAQSDHSSSGDCITCHQHSSAFSPPGCSDCHGGGMIGAVENSFWPDSGVKNVDNPGSEDDEGEHVIHITHLALMDGMTLQNLLDDANSKIMQIGYCERCHGPNAGSAGYHYQKDDVGDIGAFQDMDGTADDMAPVGSYNSGTCSNIDCHNNKNTASPDWYAGVDNAPCSTCHTVDGTNPNTVKIDPSSGLHYSASAGGLVADSNGALIHDDSFTGGGNCLSCHTINPTNNHVDGTVQTPDQTTFNFLIDASIDIKLNTLSDTTDDTCAANCHSDSKNWYRFWSADAFDATAFDTSSAGAITTTIANDLPPRCNVCHGEGVNGWAEGTAHADMLAREGVSGISHNSQNPSANPGAGCVDCHVYPDYDAPGAGAARHNNGSNKITLSDDQIPIDNYTPIEDTTGPNLGVYCAPCHENVAGDGHDGNTFPFSNAFGNWSDVEVVSAGRNPEYTCFSGQNGCHGDTADNWWPHVDSTDPAVYPNREGAHYEHGTTIGETLAEIANTQVPGSRVDADGNGRVDATQEDRNKTCNFCHPMTWSVTRQVWEAVYHRINSPGMAIPQTDVYGGWVFPGADKKGIYSSGNPSFGGDAWLDNDTDGATGFAYQLEEDAFNPGTTYPVDHDAEYWQYLDGYKSDSSVRHGVCSQVSCHSNSPYTPGWYGDHQAPGTISDLTAETHNQDASAFPVLSLHSDHNTYEWDEPGSARLYWTAPGNNGDFNSVADQYEVFSRPAANGAITDANLPARYLPDGTQIPAGGSDDGNTKKVGNAATVLRQGEVQEMMVEGLTPGVSYNFAVVTRDAPHYKDQVNPGDGIYETLAGQSNVSAISNNATATAHTDDVIPLFYGVDKLKPHDMEKVVNLNWDSAKDHTTPIIYRIWYSTWSLKAHLAGGGTMNESAKDCYMEADPTTTVAEGGSDYCIDSETTEAINYQIVVPNSGSLYSFLVRAKDGVGNFDDNTNVQMVLPKSAPMESVVTQLYLVNSSQGLDLQADIANPSWPGSDSDVVMSSTDLLVWESATTIARQSMVSGISFDIQTANARRDPITLSVELGYMVGASFNRIGTMTPTNVQDSAVALGKKSTRLQKFSLSGYKGLIPENSKLAIRLDRWDASSSTDLTLTSGTTATKGQLLVNVQPYNNQPNGSFAIALNSPEVRSGGYIDIAWVSANPQDVGQTVHYDIFGSADGGSSYPYVIATAVTDIDDLNGAEYGRVTWDTVGDGLTSSYSCKVKVEVGDGYQYEDPSAPNYPDPFEEIAPTVWSTHNVFESATIAVDNNTDVEPPASVTIMSAETRPKQGSVYLTWTAVGDDGLNHGTRVAYYDIRYRPDPIGTGTIDAGGNWDVAVQAEGEPVPGFSGSLESFDLLGLAPELEYDIGIKACDEADNCSTLGALSTSEGWRTDAAQSLPDPIKGGPFYCGICHSTPPDEPDTKGIHREHGFTLEDCAKCHGDGTNPSGNDVTQYDGRHYNGFIDIGWAKSDVGGNQAALVQIPIENGGATDVTITQTTVNNGAVTIYQDLGDGAGGYNMPAGQTATATAYTDSGTCMNFGLSNSNGCHGPFQPQWAPSVANPTPTAPACSDCHGDSSAARNWDPYGRIWDCNDAGAPSELVKASPPIDNHGESALTSKYTGAHERHLNSSFRFAKGDSCRLCHLDTMYSGEHADGKVDIRFDEGANQSDSLQAVSQFDGPEATTGMSCGQLSTDSCHDTFESDGVTPKALVDWPVWNVDGAQCDSCHGMSTMGTVPHISDNGARACDWCHLAGHPQSPDGVNPGDSAALLVNNNPAVGIDYKSGGIHIRLNINNRDTLVGGEPVDTLAEICWACHEAQSSPISEWGGDDTPTNTVVEPYNGVGSIYDYGSLNITSWYADTTQGSEVGATWSSADATNFGYKTGRIQSTHSTDPSGVSTVTWDAANGRYNETIDAVAKIRCTNCHDVHDLNKTDGDTVSGAPYLRGTWKSNPYEEDGAPWNKNFTSVGAAPQFGPVPRGATAYIEKGGYFIDQNNVRPGTTTSAQYPTSGWTMASSAGLCALCHDSDVDGMDQLADEYLWVGQGVSDNGHSNSAVGGTFVNSTNVFDYTHGRPTPPATEPNIKGTSPTGIIPDMAVMARATATIEAGETYIYAYRSTRANGPMAPEIAANYAYNSYNWGATVDAGQTDTMYHQFSCSKCHNPHASRLPKLMITNCLDIRHNTWDDGKSTRQNSFTNSALSAVDRNMPAAYYASAQNCHRFDPARSGIERGGWNRVTPWVKKNDGTNSEHKGSMDTAYGDTSPTYHKFPTENTGW